MSPDETCDYCFATEATRLRFLGFTVMDGYEYPEVKLWCGDCELPDDRRPEAAAAQLAWMTRQPARKIDA